MRMAALVASDPPRKNFTISAQGIVSMSSRGELVLGGVHHGEAEAVVEAPAHRLLDARVASGPRTIGPKDMTQSMYSLPSTSQTRHPLPRFMKMG